MDTWLWVVCQFSESFSERVHERCSQSMSCPLDSVHFHKFSVVHSWAKSFPHTSALSCPGFSLLAAAHSSPFLWKWWFLRNSDVILSNTELTFNLAMNMGIWPSSPPLLFSFKGRYDRCLILFVHRSSIIAYTGHHQQWLEWCSGLI